MKCKFFLMLFMKISNYIPIQSVFAIMNGKRLVRVSVGVLRGWLWTSNPGCEGVVCVGALLTLPGEIDPVVLEHLTQPQLLLSSPY